MASNKLNIFIQDLKNTYTVLQQLELCIKTCKDTLRGFDDLTNHIDELDLDTLDAKLDEINAIIESADLDTLTTDVAQLKTSVSDLQTLVGSLQTSVSTVETNVNNMSSTLSVLSNTVRTLSTTISEMQTSVSALQSLVSNLQATVTTLNGNVASNTSDITNLKGRTNILEGIVSINSGNITNLQGRVTTLEGKHLYRHEIEARLYSPDEDTDMRFKISLVSNTGEVETYNDFIDLMYGYVGLMVWNYDDDTPSTLIEVNLTDRKIEFAIYNSQSHLWNGVQFTRFNTEEEHYFTDNVTLLI